MDITTLVALLLIVAAAAAIYLKFSSKPKALADPTKKVPVSLIEKESLSHDVRRFRFALPNPNMVLGLPPGKHLFISTMKDGKLLSRPYSPVSPQPYPAFVSRAHPSYSLSDFDPALFCSRILCASLVLFICI